MITLNRKTVLTAALILCLSLALSAAPALAASPALADGMPVFVPDVTAAPTPLTAESFIRQAKEGLDPQKEYVFDLFGQQVSSIRTTRLEYLKVPIGDESLDVFRQLLPLLPNLKHLSFDRCETTDEAVAKLRDDFPDREIVWRIFFSPFSCMTDIETIWASVDLRNETCGALKYCTKVKNLDIGHSAMTDLSFLDYMPDLEVLIIACSDFDDISHVANCKKLTYFECAECVRLKDLSPIAELKELEHLNIGGCYGITDLSCLHHLDECKNLKRFYAQNMNGIKNIDQEELFFRHLLPNVEMDFGFYGGMGSLNTGFWRYTRGSYTGHFVAPYQHIRDIFGYDDPYSQPRLWGG